LDAVETLGAVEIIGLDKTGTLTENRMTTAAIFADGVRLALEGNRVRQGEAEAAGAMPMIVRRLFEVASLCSDAAVRAGPNGPLIEGSPTECALIEAALAVGIDVAALHLTAPILATAPRGDGRKRMSTLHKAPDGGRMLCVKGDPTEVLAHCARRITVTGDVLLDSQARSSVLRANERMAGQALRVLGVAVGEAGGNPHDERDLTWLGLVGLANPIRPSVRPTLVQLHGAGIRTVMITGDQSATAIAIARELDLGDGGELRVLEAGQIAGLPQDVLAALVAQAQVFARVSPVDKLNIVRALQSSGRIVAMTGDGINDGPALRAADIGIAMGAEGNDVAREVADIVLAGNDLNGIIEAIRLGRATYANIRKVLRYLVSTNASETFLMLGAALMGKAAPLTPMQLLWLNLASDALPALALGLDPAEERMLEQPPHDPRAPILSPADFRRILREGAVMGTSALTGFLLASSKGIVRASTVTLHGLTIAQLLHAVSCRSETSGIAGELHRPPNRKLYGAFAASLALQAVVQVFPFTRRIFGLAPVGLRDLSAIAGIAVASTAMNDLIGYLVGDNQQPDGLAHGT
jgi:Ca2+-transporting ATPase